MVKKILVYKGKEFAWKKGDLHTNFGMIKEDLLNNCKGKVKSQMGKEFTVLNPSFLDKIRFMKRGPQMPFPKDVAVILFYANIDRNSKVIDAGTGSGLIALSLARFVKSVVSYELKKDVYNLAQKNVEDKNIKLKNKDISKGIDEKNVDAVILDMPEPWHVLKHARTALKNSGSVVTYLPSLTQVEQLVDAAKRYDFFIESTVEIIEREWIIDKPIIRPKHHMYGHTAFLTFLRKIE